MVQQPGDEDIKVIKVERNPFCKDPKPDFNALGSPTTPLQFEARQSQYYPPALFDDAARIQNSIQLQLLNYLRSLGAQPNNLYSQHHQGMGIPSEYLGAGAVEHPTIALLQQRFQRLERDKEMRQAKQLHRGYSSQGQVLTEAGKFPSSNSSSSHSPGSCNLQLSLPIKCTEPPHSLHLSGNYLGRNEAWSYPASAQQMSSPSTQPGFSLFRDHDNLEVELRNPASFPLNFPAETNELEVHSSRNNKLLSLLPASNSSSSNFPVQQHNHCSSSCSTVHYQQYNGQCETQFFLRNWKTAAGRESIPVVADDDVDTSLHL